MALPAFGSPCQEALYESQVRCRLANRSVNGFIRLEISLHVEEKVVRFEISVDDATRVNVLQQAIGKCLCSARVTGASARELEGL